jgi:hypothetical protein
MSKVLHWVVFGVAAGLWVSLTQCVPTNRRDRFAADIEGISLTLNDTLDFQPEAALGPPDGRSVPIPQSESMTLRFFRPIPNGFGPDLRVYEIGADQATAEIAVSEDGTRFFSFAARAEGPASLFDLDELGLSSVLFVEVRGLDNGGIEPGFDLDALEALN